MSFEKGCPLFFRGAGVEQKHYVDLDKRVRADSSSITKFEIVRSVLTRLNATGEKALRERREVLKRVTQFEEFETCWDDDRLQAKGLVAEVLKLVNVKDSFTRMEQEKDRERLARQKQIEQKQKAEEDRRVELKSIRAEFFKLFAVTDRQKRGKLLEAAMNRLFKAHGIGLREAFILRSDDGSGVVEQIDGVIELEGNVYLVEMKWWGEALGPSDVAQHLVRVYHRGHARGMFIPMLGIRTRPLKCVVNRCSVPWSYCRNSASSLTSWRRRFHCVNGSNRRSTRPSPTRTRSTCLSREDDGAPVRADYVLESRVGQTFAFSCADDQIL
jgi:restriction system protein